MKKIICVLVMISVFFLTSCSDRHRIRQAQFQSWLENNNKLKVLSSTAMIDDLVKQIGGEHVDSIVLIQGELDPHSYQLVKGDDEKLSYANIIFYNGLGLEHGPSLYHYLQNNSKAVPLGDLLYKQDPSLIINVNDEKDPHIWMDISLWAKTIPFIVEALSLKDPLHASDYQRRADLLKDEMNQVNEQVKKLMHEVPAEKRFLVTSHDAFNYFTRAYLSEQNELESGDWQKRFAAPEGLAPESQLSATDIREIINHLRRYNVHLLFSESNVSRDSIKKIVQAGSENGLDVKIACCPLYGDAMGSPGSGQDTYMKMILYNAKTLSSHMSQNSKEGSVNHSPANP